MDTLYIYVGIAGLAIVIIVGYYIFRHLNANKNSDVPIVEEFKPLENSLFTDDLEQASIVEPDASYDNEYGECATNPLIQCHIFANFGRFDMCKEIMENPETQAMVKPAILTEMLAWINKKLTSDSKEHMLMGWDDKWIVIEADPVKEAKILIAGHFYEDARELLEDALLHAKGNPTLVRAALRDVSKLICGPR